MTTAPPPQELESIHPDDLRRVRITTSCTDSDGLPKVDRAGEVFDVDGVPVQLMHNGVMVEAGCYYGPWMTAIIRGLRGHHEPQEELVFHHVLERLASSSDGEPTMIELGSFWAYYSLWFHARFPKGRIVAMEPDPAYLEVGRRNFALNGWPDAATFVHGALGPAPGAGTEFLAESSGEVVPVTQHDLASLMSKTGLEHADLVLADVQGLETVLLERAASQLAGGRVRFMVVSTHHHSISGDPLTHQRALAQLTEAGAHVIAEHSVAESFSGDGLIVVSFDDRDRDFVVEVSRARAKDSLFGEPEVELAGERRRSVAAETRAASLAQELLMMQTAQPAAAPDHPAPNERRAVTRAAAVANRQIDLLRSTVARWRKGREQDQAVVWAYRYLLDREPESKDAVRGHAGGAANWREVRSTIAGSPEYAAKQLSSRPSISGFESPMELELTDDPETTAALLGHIATTWTSLGELDPHYSVVTNEDFRRESFDANEDDFFAGGEGDVRRFRSTAARAGLTLRQAGRWLELGCGVGRVTPFLAAEAGHLIGMDVSASHLELARQRLQATGSDNVELRLLTRVEDLDELPELDVFFSVIVLQHNPPPVIRAILDRILARIAPGGVAYFQVPTYRQDYRFDLDDYLSTTAQLNEMEMHVLPQREIIRCAAAHGLELVEMLEDTCTGMRPGEVSNTFLFHKPEG